MRIASFNLENLGTPDNKGIPLSSRIAILRPQLERLNADIICLQEVNGEKTPNAEGRTLAALDTLIEGTPYEDYLRANSVDPVAGRLSDKHNLVVLSRWSICESKQISHDVADRFDGFVGAKRCATTPEKEGKVVVGNPNSHRRHHQC
jgi:endonuclease/exonuclease/phosphatase family metal-dependent hydrolase